MNPVSESLTLHYESPQILQDLIGPHSVHLRFIKESFQLQIACRDNWIKLDGNTSNLSKAKKIFAQLESIRRSGTLITAAVVQMLTDQANEISEENTAENLLAFKLLGQNRKGAVLAKTKGQLEYLRAMKDHEVVFGIGPAGTGKTYLAVAQAIHAFRNKEVQRIILTRPAVEAGEALGFLPGDLKEKILPYLRPLYDALFEMMDKEEVERLAERNIIEIAPLAYMRGRTLKNAFVILDEAQNTTTEQMFMFLTRLGEGSRCVITGDPSQIDLRKGIHSGLKEAIQVLPNVEGVKLIHFAPRDVVRLAVVKRIIDAYRIHRNPGESTALPSSI